jgi:cytochrome b6
MATQSVTPPQSGPCATDCCGTKLYKWLDERLSLTTWRELAEKKLVPLHQHTIWYYLGGVALVLLLVQLVTGLLLMAYYIPEIQSAHSSILSINAKVDFGWFIRSLHSWGANLMIGAVFVHLFSTFLMKAYRKPRELTWLTGLGLLIISFGFGFTGYLLPWDEVSFFATKIGLDIASKVPLMGPWMADLLRGGEVIGQGTLSRFFLIHVMALPLALAGLLGVHLLLIQLHGMSEPECFTKLPDEQKQYQKFFPTFVLKDAMIWLLVINLLAFLVTMLPWGLGAEANPFAPAPAGIKPEWYFLAMFQFLKLLPPTIGPLEGEQVGMLIFMGIGAVFALAPFIDNTKESKWANAMHWFGVAILLGFLGFTVWGFMA